MKKLTLITLLFTPAIALAALSNAGFLQGGVWYSKDPFFAGETIRIYAALFNSGPDDISGTVKFFDNKNSIGSSDFFVERGGKSAHVWTDWTARKGQHSIEVIITSASLLRVGEPPIPIELKLGRIQENPRTVQEDTDGDQIGNNEDADDDNDRIPDMEEIKNGTNPLMVNHSGTKIQKTETTNAGPSKNIADELISLLPQDTERQLSVGHGAVREILVPIVEFLVEKERKVNGRLQGLTQNPEASPKEKAIEYLYLSSLAALSFVFKNEIVLYILAIIMSYWIIKMILRRIFNRFR